ncbi:putative helicase mov-10-B, protein [Aphelenchoides bicaudatus]|nr:putative helicase mov-10-B, protein [Aphelenchoides bicaudatus]
MASQKPIVEDGSLKYCTHRILAAKPGQPAEIELEFTFNSNQLRDEHRLPTCGDILSFKQYKTEMEIVRKAKVIKIEEGHLKLVAWIWRTTCLNGQEELRRLTCLEDERVDAYEYFSKFLYTSIARSIENIRCSNFDDFIVPKPNFHVVKKLFERKRDKFLPMLQSYANLNKEQAMALYSICTSSHTVYPFILHGPPGTGKTHTIVATVRCLLEMDPRVRILLATPSNTAADLLCVRLYKELSRSLIKKEEMLRLRSPNTDFFERNRDLDPISCIDEELRCFDIPDHSKLIQYRLIISSLGCTAHLVDRRLRPGFFTHIIIDEAGQATESEVWIPVGGLTTKKTSVVLCGDPKQLGAVYKLEMKQITTEKFGTSLTRYMEQQNLQSEPRVFCQLVQSYRCHPAILEIASRLFYDSRLIPQVTGRFEPFENWKALPNKKFPVLFVNVLGKPISNSSNSYCNEDEVKVVLWYIARLIRDDLGITPSDIGVVSPYSFQTRTMRSRLDQAGIDPRALTIDTIERYQGAERKVIIMSTVRTGSLGFVANDPRLNTSITRAKHLLIVIGHEHTLRRHPSWNTFIDYCKENGSHIQWTGRVKNF